MIKAFRNKGLAEFWEAGSTKGIDRNKQRRILPRLDALEQASGPEDLRLPGLSFHPLHGFEPTRYAIAVNGPWRITFEFVDGHARQVDFEQYH